MPSPTFAPTATPVPTAVCALTKPKLTAPAQNATLSGTTVRLVWQGPNCATRYELVVKRDSLPSRAVFYKSVHKTRQTLSTLAAGHQYFWRVRACNTTCGTWSKWGVFNMK